MFGAGVSFKLGRRGVSNGIYLDTRDLVRRVDTMEENFDRRVSVLERENEKLWSENALQAKRIESLEAQMQNVLRALSLTDTVKKSAPVN